MPEWIAKYWLEWVFGILIAVLTWVVKTMSNRLKKQQTEYDAIRDGMRSLLRGQIISISERVLHDGWCGIPLRDSISDMYASYHSLGGNGAVTSVVEQVAKLPAVKPGKEEE